jgi:hypothetical protein
MKKPTTVKLILLIIPIFILSLLGMIWYNANFIQKIDEEYSQLLESNSLNSNSLAQSNINTAYAMHLCYQMVFNGNNNNWEGFVNSLDSIKKDNANFIVSLSLNAKSLEQKQKLAELIIVRANLIEQRDSLVKLVQQNLPMEAKVFLQTQMATTFTQFFKASSSYLMLAQEESKIISKNLSAKNEIVKQINQYLFWLPIVCFVLFTFFILFIFFRVYHISKDDIDF